MSYPKTAFGSVNVSPSNAAYRTNNPGPTAGINIVSQNKFTFEIKDHKTLEQAATGRGVLKNEEAPYKIDVPDIVSN
jgi:hypothetical protein